MTSPPPVMPEEDYEAIEAAVMDTARGRWFLAEFARRNRSADTAILLAAIERLEKTMGSASPVPHAAPAALPSPDPKPHAPVGTGLATSASAELFAIERQPEPSHIPSAGLPDDGISTWIIEDRAPSAPVPSQIEIVELDDVGLIWPHSEEAKEQEPPSASAPGPAAEPQASSAQNAMLSTALAAAQETVARAADAPPPLPPGSHSPQSVDPATLDSLSFEEKTVYFG